MNVAKTNKQAKPTKERSNLSSWVYLKAKDF